MNTATFVFACLVACVAGQASSQHWLGVWSESQWGGGPLNICSDGGNEVVGFFSNRGFIRGAINGRFLTGWWHTAGPDPSLSVGRFELRIPSLNDVNDRFEGQWWYGDKEDGPYRWEGRHLSYTEPSSDECFTSGGGSVAGVWQQRAEDVHSDVDVEKDLDDHYFVLCIIDGQIDDEGPEYQGLVRGSFHDLFLDGPSRDKTWDGAFFGFSTDPSSFQGSWATSDGRKSGDLLAKTVSSETARYYFYDGHGPSAPVRMVIDFERSDPDNQFGESDRDQDKMLKACEEIDAASVLPKSLVLALVSALVLALW